ncbi:breast carcinoma-amplified sequence 1 isoform X1 [Alosa alosa]|uniref:breast carcinoma-amplified sequence 1 isoform X1 n=1 Tax=Alosa alosa TaxID=278164 RepID=UPI0020150F8B|nr:breast carcinoma-amplified sequence 1 isoform X1 [Alosa alosa]XP_048097263.1 breast carcinoma-amplified sequence 1 isoform X1 [Alosa alosa]
MGNEMSSHKKKGRKGKVQNGDLNGHAVNASSDDMTETVTTTEVTVEASQCPALAVTTNADPSPVVEATGAGETDGVQEQSQEQSVDKAAAEQTDDAVCVIEESKSPGENKSNFFNKLFNKKSDTKPVEVDVETHSEEVVSADQVDAEEVTNNLQSEPVDIKDSTELELPERESLHSSPAVTEQNQSEDNPVMNFFKTLVTPTKTPKEAAASSDVSKDQSQKETAATTAPANVSVCANVQEVEAKGKMAPPPPPEPLKMEGKTEPTAEKEESQPAPKEIEAGAKPKSAKESAFSKLFRPKVLLGLKASKAVPRGTSASAKPATVVNAVEETAAPVEVETDASKAATLEACAKLEPAPAVKQEEEKAEKKPSTFASFFKPKVLLDQVTSKIQVVASTSRIRGAAKSAGPAAEPTKDSPAVAANPEPPQAPKAKEEARAAPPSAPPAPPAPPLDKSVESAENPSPTVPRREKRNSIQLFFKNLAQKRHSDAGVQTEAAAPSTAEKGK